MVKGLNLFREYFRDYTDQYVLIGGAACDISFERHDAEFRATKDLDMVLIVESLTKDFGHRFWAFIKDGGYQNLQKSSGKPEFYRFEKPAQEGYPFMIELFARTSNSLPPELTLIPIHIDDDVSSLSAILLNESYYKILLEGRTVIDGVSILDSTWLIPFKIKAWLDLREKKAKGLHVNTRDLKKHRNDVVRIVAEMPLVPCDLPTDVREDISTFLRELDISDQDIQNMGFNSVSLHDIRERLEDIYLL